MSLPDRLGRLRKGRRLGSGGFATVWLYHDDDLDSDVAVKALADNWIDVADVRERFLAESRLLRQAQSDHLIQVHDVGVTDDGTPYFVMPYADRGSVQDLISSTARPTPAQIVQIVAEAAAGLAALHARGIVHRDIKPENLLLLSRPDGTTKVVVADLGVAKSLTAHSGATMQVGTPSYAAPEQADTAHPLDPRADVHGLGAVTYALIAGHPPVRRDGRPQPLDEVVTSLPPAVNSVVMAAVEPDRDHRWNNVDAYARAFADAVAGQFPTVPTPPTTVRKPSDAGTKRRPVVALIASVVALVAVGVAAYAWMNRPDPVTGYEVAARQFLTALQDHDCAKAASYVDKSSDWDCLHPAEGEFAMVDAAEKIDLSAPVRVEDLGDGQFRVVFVEEGYVLVRKRDDSTMAIEGLVAV